MKREDCPEQLNSSQLWILEQNKSHGGYVNRFEDIKSLIISKNGVSLELNSDEAKQLYRHLRPKI